MANIIKIKAGSGVPTTSDIIDREIAFNRSDNKLYINDSGTIVNLSGAQGGGSADEADRIVFDAQAGEALSKGDVVYISGISGNTPIVNKADADDANKMPSFGLASSSASLNSSVQIVTFGTLENLDTSAFTVGDTVFVSTTAGGLTATAPTGESGLIQNMGHIVRSHASTGAIKLVGAGRSAATPNLNEDKIFLGNSSNQSVSTALSSIGLSKFNNDLGFGGGANRLITDDGDGTVSTEANLTFDGTLLHISKETSTTGTTGTTLFKLTNDVGNDLSQQKTFVDFALLDNNSNEIPQVRIGAEVGQNGDANSQEKEGSGAFVVYTNNADTTSGDAGASLAERMRVDYQGNVGIGTQSPGVELHVKDASSHAQLRIETDSASHGAYLELEGSANKYQIYNVGGDLGIDESGVATRFIIKDSTGNVGIGTSSPGRQLTLYGEAVIRLDGNSADPGLDFNTSGTSDMQIRYRGSSDKLQVYSYGTSTNVMTIQKSDGFVGIGDTNPPNKLSVKGSSTDLLYLEGDGITSNSIIQSATGGSTRIRSAGGKVEFYTGGANNSSSASGADFAMVVREDGKVGIGTGSPSFSYSSLGLEIQSTGDTSLRLERDGSTAFEISARSSDVLLYNVGTARAMRFGIAGGEVARIATNGNMIVGSNYTTNASTKLVVSHSGANGILLNNDDSATQNSGRLFFEGTSTSAIFQSGTALSFRSGATTGSSSGTQQMYINSSGAQFTNDVNVDGHLTLQAGHSFRAHNESKYDKYRMYGTSSAYAIGMYSGNAFGGLNDWAMTFTFNDEADRGFLWRDTAHSQGQGAMSLTTNGKLAVAHSARIGYGESDTTTPGATYRLDVSGSIGATADVVAYISSDKRLKDNIKNIANPLEKLEKLNGVEFDWNDKQDLYKGHDIGVIAQEVEEVLPEIVDTREDGHKAVKYDRMVALLIEAVKEQQQQINELKEKLNV
jgi:hypothetical protein